MDIPDIAQLPSVAWDCARDMPAVRAVYFLLDAAGTVLYIGRSERVVGRCSSYSRPKLAEIGVARIAWWAQHSTLEAERAEIEAIRRYRPRHNVTGHPAPEDAQGTVPVRAVAAALGIPRSTLYRLVEEKKVRAHDVTADYHQRRQYRFLVSEVRADLDRIKKQRGN